MKLQELYETSKPSSWADVKDTISPGEVDENKVPHHSTKDLWASPNPSPLDKFDKHPSAEKFVLSVGNNAFLISTGGGNYIRTALRLE